MIKTTRLDIIPGPQAELGGLKYLRDLIAIYGDDDVKNYMRSGERHRVTESYIHKLLKDDAAEWRTRGCGSLFCIDRASDRMVGFVRSVPSHTDGLHHELVYSLHPDFRGQRFAQEAISALLQYEFQQGRGVIIATLNPDNEVSRHVLVKLGFKRGPDHQHGDEIEQVYECTPDTFSRYVHKLD